MYIPITGKENCVCFYLKGYLRLETKDWVEFDINME